MSRNCTEKPRETLGDTMASVIVLQLNYYFAVNFRQVCKDGTVVFKRYYVPLLQDGL